MRRSCRKPRLNHDANRCFRSLSSGRRCRLLAQASVDFLAHGNQGAGAAGRHVHPSQQFLPRRIGGLRQRRSGFGRRLGQIGLRRGTKYRCIGRKTGRQKSLKLPAILHGKFAENVVQLAGDRSAGSFAALRQQRRRKLFGTAEWAIRSGRRFHNIRCHFTLLWLNWRCRAWRPRHACGTWRAARTDRRTRSRDRRCSAPRAGRAWHP